MGMAGTASLDGTKGGCDLAVARVQRDEGAGGADCRYFRHDHRGSAPGTLGLVDRPHIRSIEMMLGVEYSGFVRAQLT